MTSSPSSPAVVQRALRRPPRTGSHRVHGARVAWLEWGDRANRSLIFVHGGAAHAWWWAFTAPALADDFHVVAMELSGHGDSDRRNQYDFVTWAEEVLSVAAACTTDQPPIIIGHSMGGIVTAVAAGMRHRIPLAGVIVIDAPPTTPDAQTQEAEEAALGRTRSYADRTSAVQAFRLRPRQPHASEELLHFVADRSVTRDAGGQGWTWRYDPLIFSRRALHRPSSILSELASFPGPVGYLIGGQSAVITAGDRRLLEEAASRRCRVRLAVLAEGGHHLMFDQPGELVDAVTGLLEHCLSPGPAATTLPSGTARQSP